MIEFRYDTQLLIEGEHLDEDAINDYFTEHFKGDCLLAVSYTHLDVYKRQTERRGKAWWTTTYGNRE